MGNTTYKSVSLSGHNPKTPLGIVGRINYKDSFTPCGMLHLVGVWHLVLHTIQQLPAG